MIKNVLVDVGGVLIDLHRSVAVDRLRELGVTDADEMLDAYRQTGGFLDYESGRISTEDFAHHLSETYHREITIEQLRWALLGFLKRVCKEKLTFLEEEIAPHYRVLALSNTNPLLYDYFESKDFISSGRPLSDFFERVFTSYTMGMCKPEREIFLRVLEEGNLLPEETLFLNDGPANTAMARSLGMVAYTCKNEEDWRDPIRRVLVR